MNFDASGPEESQLEGSCGGAAPCQRGVRVTMPRTFQSPQRKEGAGRQRCSASASCGGQAAGGEETMWPAEGFYIRAKKWVDEFQRQGNPHLVMAFVGNKVALEAKRKVGTQEALEYAERPLLPGDVGEDGAEHRRALLRAREICMSSATLDVTPRPAVTLSHRSERRSQEGSSRKEWEG